jgi:hypothetical protein
VRAAIVAVLVLCPALARAAVPAGNCTDLATCLQAPPRPPRSPGVALALSLGTSLAGVAALAVAGQADRIDPGSQPGWLAIGVGLLAVGPTTGHLYANHPLNTGLAIRLASGAVGALGAGLFVDGGGRDGGGESLGGAALVVAGAFGYAAAMFYEIGDAPAAADRYNRRRRATLAPIAGGSQLGLALAGAF